MPFKWLCHTKSPVTESTAVNLSNVPEGIRPAQEAHLLSVEEAEIHRLANVAIGFLPSLADLVNFHRRKLETTPLHDGRDPLK